MRDGRAIYVTSGNSNYYIYDCSFQECKTNGAIYIERSNTIRTLLEDSVFNKCSSDSEGGSVFYHCEEAGQFVQQRTRYSNSKANSYIAFCQWIKISDSYKNYAYEVSVSNCGESESKGSETILISLGDIRISNINSTYNKCNHHSSVESVVEGCSGTCNFSNFINNNQIGSVSLEFWINGDSMDYKQTVTYCNVLGNKCGTDNNQVLFSAVLTTNVYHCIFLCNIAKFMFRQFEAGFTLTISDSYVESQSTKSTVGNVKFTDLKQNYDFNDISHFNIENCFVGKNIKAKSALKTRLSLSSLFGEVKQSTVMQKRRRKRVNAVEGTANTVKFK